MRRTIVPVLLLWLFAASLFAADGRELKTIVDEALAVEPTLANAEPDGKVSRQIERVSAFMDALTDEADETDNDEEYEKIAQLAYKATQVKAVLEQRRIYRYMLWAEKRLRICMRDESKLDSLSQDQLFERYRALAEINISEIPEPILAREITSALAKIYELFSPENKPKARMFSVYKNADFYTQEQKGRDSDFAPRKTPKDF